LRFLSLSFVLLIGIFGYHYTAEANWLDSLHNASMILSGIGPVIEIQYCFGKSIFIILCFVQRDRFYNQYRYHTGAGTSSYVPSAAFGGRKIIKRASFPHRQFL